MGQISISITKKVTFRDSVQHFSNVYTYGSVDSNPIFGTGANLIEQVADLERALHSTDVSFVKGRMWSSGGTKEQNEMIVEIPLTGTGNTTGNASQDRERAVLVMWKAGKDSRGKAVYLRKWYHSCGSIAGVSFTAGHLQNTTKLSDTNRAEIATAVDGLTRIGNLNEWGLIAASGRERDGDPPTCHPYLEHHQLGDEWRVA